MFRLRLTNAIQFKWEGGFEREFLEGYIEQALTQTHNNALKLAVEKLKEIKSPMLGKDQHGTELYEAGTGQMQRNETIDQAIKNINSLVI